MITRLRRLIIVVVFLAASSLAAQLLPTQLDDLYKTDTATDVIPLDGGKSAIYIRQRVDQKSRAVKQSLWRVDAEGKASAVENGEPDAFSPMLAPDG